MSFTENIYPTILVFIQLCSLVFLLVSGPVIANGVAAFLLEITGVFLGLLAIYVMGLGNFNIRPIVKNNGVLISSGPYRIIRHPMYLAQVLVVVPLVCESFTYWRLAVLLLLVIVLTVKIEYEEKRLLIHFLGYKDYKKTTKKVIPFIY